MRAIYYPEFYPTSRWLRTFLLFYEQINAVAPASVPFNPPSALADLLLSDPTCFDFLRFDHVFVNPIWKNLDSLEAALKDIAENNRAKGAASRRMPLAVSDIGLGAIDGVSQLHEFKITPAVGRLLHKYSLISEVSNVPTPAISRAAAREYHHVDTRAADLIVARLAIELGRAHGLPTLTAAEIPYTVGQLSHLGCSSLGAGNSLLVSSFLSAKVPEEIERLTTEQYLDLRDSYQPFRESFHTALGHLAALHNLRDVKDWEILGNRTREIVADLEVEAYRLQQGRLGRAVRRWATVIVGGLATMANVALAAKYPQATGISYTMAGVTVTLGIIDKMTSSNREPPRTALHNMMGKLRKTIIRRATVRRYVGRSPTNR